MQIRRGVFRGTQLIIKGAQIERVPRTVATWRLCLKNHAADAHGGKVLESCAACRELQGKIKAA